MVFVVGVGLDGGEDGVFADEAGDVVDVAVGVVAGAAAVEPDGLVDAEVVVEGLFEVLAGSASSSPRPGLRCWISERRHSSVVRRSAGAVGVDAAAFEDEAVGLAVGDDRPRA